MHYKSVILIGKIIQAAWLISLTSHLQIQKTEEINKKNKKQSFAIHLKRQGSVFCIWERGERENV